jgi:hypothetical protein
MKITISKIKQYIEGNTQMILDKIGMQPKWYQEQIAYRSLMCGDCIKAGACKECGCEVPGKLYVAESCNEGKRFPDLMSEEEWIKYKQENGIT